MTIASPHECAVARSEIVDRQRDSSLPLGPGARAHEGREFACDPDLYARACVREQDDDELPDALWERALHGPVRHVFARPGKGFRGRLAFAAYRLGGGLHAPPELARIVETLHAGSLVVDDVEDQSIERRGAPALHRVYGNALAINTGNWLYFQPARSLAQLGLPSDLELAAHRELAETMSHAHRGQALDLALCVSQLEQGDVPRVARAIARLKTGALMAFAARLGALCARASEQSVEAFARFGSKLGVCLQQLDDWGGLASARFRHKGYEDLRFERVTWPWAVLAETLDDTSFRALVEAARTDDLADRERVRERMCRHLRAIDGPERPRRALRAALDELAGAFAVTPAALAALEDEIARLEVSYG